MIKETIKEVRPNLFKKGYTEVLDTSVQTNKKAEARYKIEKEVFDEKDSLADTAKWLSLLTTLVSMMYETFTETQKAKMPAEQRALIEYTFTKFKATNTRGDVQFAQEGIAMVDKLLARQAQIGALVK